MYCIECGSKLPDDAFFCQECGKKLHKYLPETTDNQIQENYYLNIEIPHLLRSNSYHILGMDTSCSPKEVRMRGKEIISHLKIDDLPEYDLDIENPRLFRNEQSVKASLQKLNSPKTGFKEFFFWFHLTDSQFKKDLISALKENNPDAGLEKIVGYSDTNDDTKFLMNKNIALFVSIFLSQRKFKPYLSFSLDLWKTLIYSDNFWERFIKSFSVMNHFDITKESISELKSRVISALSDLYTEIGQITNDPEYILEFHKKFAIKGKKVKHNFLDPISLAIETSIEGLASINISKDFPSDKIIEKQIDSFLSKIKYELYRLEILGLYEDSQAIYLRDHTAETIRTMSIKIFKEGNKQKEALKLVKFARDIAGTSALCMMLNNDIKQLDEIIQNNISLSNN